MAAQPRCKGEPSGLDKLARLVHSLALFFRSPCKLSERSERVLPHIRCAEAPHCENHVLTFGSQALLGITISPEDERSHPNAPLLSAGTRRQSACMAFLAQAHQACFESSLAEEVSVENLAAILSLMQMSICELGAPLLDTLAY
jgi:hypothetical protein